jgi:hypothetical protein
VAWRGVAWRGVAVAGFKGGRGVDERRAESGQLVTSCHLSSAIRTRQDKHDNTLLLDLHVFTSDQHGDFSIQERQPVSTLDGSRRRSLISSKPLSRPYTTFTLIPAHTADLVHHTEIILPVIPRLKYSLRLLVDNEEKDLQRIDNRTWEPAKPLYAPCFFDTCTC